MHKIKGFENYLIDEDGNVYSLLTHKNESGRIPKYDIRILEM